jgi:hypothetical protein
VGIQTVILGFALSVPKPTNRCDDAHINPITDRESTDSGVGQCMLMQPADNRRRAPGFQIEYEAKAEPTSWLSVMFPFVVNDILEQGQDGPNRARIIHSGEKRGIDS